MGNMAIKKRYSTKKEKHHNRRILNKRLRKLEESKNELTDVTNKKHAAVTDLKTLVDRMKNANLLKDLHFFLLETLRF